MDSINNRTREDRPARQQDHQHLEDLLARIADGDHHALEALYHQTRSRIYGLVRKVLIDPDLSEDTMQEVYLQIWHSADKFTPSLGKPITWMITIAHRRAVDKVRSEQRLTDRTARYASGAHVIDHDVVEEAVQIRAEAEAVNACLASLTPLQHQSITMAYYNGLTYRQVAERLALPVPTIKTRIRDGLQKLQTCLHRQIV